MAKAIGSAFVLSIVRILGGRQDRRTTGACHVDDSMSGIVETIREADASGHAFLLRVQLRSGETLRGAVMGDSFDDMEHTKTVNLDLWHLDRGDPIGATRLVRFDEIKHLEVEW
ncbi:hypothetical protein P3T23_008037 [Paraburkholderia sp. GAS448]|uniref:hypothetical protein n=1 Tax=Paraburkholderia sp. GAS448 TaxID=3035136 RepID=UPI003D255E57